ncbi:MAG: hypothetical protein AAFZ92_11165, partial [Pseudomonadota bacterium]
MHLNLKNHLNKALLLMLGSMVLSLLIMAWIAGTQAGTRWLSARIVFLIPELQIQQIHGQLLGPLSVQGLRFRSSYIDVDIESLSLRWSPRHLLTKTLLIQSLDVDGITIKPYPADNTRAASQTDGAKAPLDYWQLPIAINIQTLSLTDAQWHNADPGQRPISVEQL